MDTLNKAFPNLYMAEASDVLAASNIGDAIFKFWKDRGDAVFTDEKKFYEWCAENSKLTSKYIELMSTRQVENSKAIRTITWDEGVGRTQPPTLHISGDDCWIRTYKPSPNSMTGVCEDETYLTDKATLMYLFFKSNPGVYVKEVKKTRKEEQQDQERIDDIQAFLFNYSNIDRYNGCMTILAWDKAISLEKHVKDPINIPLYNKILDGYTKLGNDLRQLRDEEVKAGGKALYGVVQNDKS